MRLFIAVDFPLNLKKKITSISQEIKSKYTIFPAKFVETENLHITLRFLGETTEEKEKEIIRSLSEIDLPSFGIKMEGGGTFPPRTIKPRVLYLTIESKELVSLAGKVSKALDRVGIPPEKRPFKSHLTIARVKDKIFKKKLEFFYGLASNFQGRAEISSFVLFQSILKPQGPEYIKRHIFHLK